MLILCTRLTQTKESTQELEYSGPEAKGDGPGRAGARVREGHDGVDGGGPDGGGVTGAEQGVHEAGRDGRVQAVLEK